MNEQFEELAKDAHGALSVDTWPHERRDWFRVTLSSIGDAVITTDRAGRVTFMNPVAASLTGWAPDDAEGKSLETVFRIVNEHTRRSVENPVDRVLREGVVVGLANHTVLIDKDGGERPITDSAAPIESEDGKVSGVVLIFRDVTTERRAEEFRRQLAAIVESSDDAILSQSLEGAIASWNKGAERLFGYAAGEIIGQPIATLIPLDHADELAVIVDAIRRRETTDHFETVRRRKDGSIVDVSVNVSPIVDAAGQLVGASTIARDITESKRAERRRAARLAVTQILAEASSINEAIPSILQSVCGALAWDVGAFWRTDEEAQQLRCVECWHRPSTKVAEFETITRTLAFVPGVGLPGRIWTSRQPAWIPDVVKDSNFPRAPIADREGLHAAFGFPVVVGNEFLGVIEFFSREIREPDADLLEMMGTIGGQIGQFIERKRAEDALRTADRRKEEFLALLGHELRNPLAPITSALQVLKLPQADDAMRSHARDVLERQVEHMVRLVDDLLDVSRIMRGKVELRREPLDLAIVIARAVETVQPMIDAEGHHLELSLSAEPLPVYGDLLRLAQVVANLLNNAAKYTERGGRITLSTAREGVCANVCVRDTGIGLAPEMLSRIFDMFFQGSQPADGSRGGLGIGLSLVRDLVEAHGGSVEAHSAGLGSGSEFVVRLPIEEGIIDTARPASTSHEQFVSRCILVVDDNTDAADSLAMLLRLLGHEAIVSYDGPSAIAKAEARPPAVAFLDLGMPNMDGYEVARRLLAHPALGNIVLVALTGWGQPEDRQRTKEAGFDRHLVKPVDAEALRCLLGEITGST